MKYNPQEPGSYRTELRTCAYLAGYQECTSPLASDPLGKLARRFTHRFLGDKPAGWSFRIVMNAYRQGWRDKARGQPWLPGESEGQA